MRKKWTKNIAILAIMVLLVTGCSTNKSSQTEADATPAAENATETTTTKITDSEVIVDTEYTASDLEVGYEETTASKITLSGTSVEIEGDGAVAKESVVTISAEGTYVITGTLSDGQIVVDAKDTDKIQLVLNGVAITCKSNAPIYIKSADKVFIMLQENTENTLIDGATYVQTDDNTVDGVIFSTADLTINGDGALNITGNFKHGIASKDDLIITGGSIYITAVKDALNGKDCVKINDGKLELSATEGNGIQSKNGDDTTKGYVYISGGDINIINSKEGIEGTAIVIEGGTIQLIAQDDGLNAASGTASTEEEKTTTESTATEMTTVELTTEEATTEEATTEEATIEKVPENRPEGFGGGGGGGGNFGGSQADANCYISITGGTITVNAEGDGIDSNGSVYVSGGTTYVSGPTNSGNGGMDYNGTSVITGGTVIVVGSIGMAQGFTNTSTQYSLIYNLTTEVAAGTEVILTDKDKKVVASYTPTKKYQSVVISTADLTKDATYTLTCGDQTAEITLSSMVTSNAQEGMGGQGGEQMNPGDRPSRGGMTKPGEEDTTESN